MSDGIDLDRLGRTMAAVERIEKIVASNRNYRNAIIEQAARVAENEPELEGEPTPTQIAEFIQAGGKEVMRAVCRATKKNIAAAIRALKDKP